MARRAIHFRVIGVYAIAPIKIAGSTKYAKQYQYYDQDASIDRMAFWELFAYDVVISDYTCVAGTSG